MLTGMETAYMNHSRYSLCVCICVHACAGVRLCLFQGSLLKENRGGWKKGLEGKKALLLRYQHRDRSTKLLISSSACVPPSAASVYLALFLLPPASLLLQSPPFSSRALLCIYFINPTLLSFSLAHSYSIYFFHFTSPYSAQHCSPAPYHSLSPS